MTSKAKQHFLSRYGPWAVVTGASSGIGRATAVRLAELGVHVVAVGRREPALRELADELFSRFGTQTLPVVSDLASPAGLDDIAAATQDIDVGLLVAAAGFGTSGEFVDADADIELEMLAVNCAAVMLQCRHFGLRFAARGRGGMVLMGSLVGFQGVPHSAHYAATKAYVQTLAEGLHEELAPSGVDVLASAPGPVRSGFEARAGMRMRAALDPDDVARGTLAALGRRTTVVPGALSKLVSWSLTPLSRPLRTRIMGRVMADMTTTASPTR